ncbi:hypothetical protein HGRIS_004985 [Hohenbuehelia grisea]|uniref:Cytochrome P450 n=1 Tax=Hohenbuehelia grisea TaxID=104357 RepID=A0ABR3JEG0_9AGAR
MSATQYLVALGIIALGFIALRPRRHLPLPPGPPADPIVAHLRYIPSKNQGAVFHQWSQTYGDVVSIRALGRTMIILDSVSAATDLLEKRSGNYSDRPIFPLYEIMDLKPNIALMSYGKEFRKHRRILHSNFTRDASRQWRGIQTSMARKLVQSLLAKPEDYSRLISWFTTALTLKIAYGLNIVSEDDEYIKIAEDMGHIMNNSGSPGGTPVDVFPFLQYLPSWFPGTYYAEVARKARPVIRKLYDLPLKKVQEDLANGLAAPSLAASELTRLMKDGQISDEDMTDIKGASMVIFAAGAETTWSTMLIFLLNIISHPEVQKRAQDEIDRVVGRNRLPNFDDYDSLPYLECVVQEVLRWHPIAPLGVPHRCMEDDIYRDMFIPKGAMVIANLRGMSWDENVYANPTKFDPMRFLPKPEGAGEPFFDSVFGFGRRICPGRHVAYNSLWIVIATLFATSNISKALDKEGREIDFVPEYQSGVVNRPKEFPCRIQSRDDDSLTLLSEGAD